MFGHHKRASNERPPESEVRCSFCNKAQDDVRKLIAGPTVYICDECVRVCNDIINDDSGIRHVYQPEPAESMVHDSSGTDRSYLVACSLCGLPVVLDEAFGVAERGFLCAGCVGAVEAAIAARHQG